MDRRQRKSAFLPGRTSDARLSFRNSGRQTQREELIVPVRRVLITGASKGIGRAVADRVARAGNVAIGLARTAPADFPGEFVTVDLSDVAATAAALDSVVAGGPVDAVVNNFGYA